MRSRSIAVLSLAAAAALVLSGCAGGAEPEASPTGTPTDMCSSVASSGAATDAVTVEGTTGEVSTLAFDTPLEVDELQARMVDEGSGDPVAAGDFVTYALSAFNAETGERLDDLGYEPGELLPVQISPQNALGRLFGCAKPGSRVVAALPASDQTAAEVYVLDLFERVPTAAWGEPQTAVEGMPTVEIAESGEPTLTVPADLATPETTQLGVLKKGDGETVLPGDNVLLQYTGVLTDGTVFDSSWQRGVPASFSTTGVVTGFAAALEGQTVGSQVVAVIPPAEGYGEAGQGSIPANATLVFVVDILGTQHATQ
ncbi:FKBP-type peptidyl-prolyl cis-trans isomerase [Microbacterium sp. No. 7]|uniref:FKBP-type peptidyl-prolyl cis-trans isomerase n=1 Tax=Microbacterium sp. No. 7 TaxID=1714373 RepID=UPI0006D1D233|nr:FKBP-type peptidyl-prolyl cis-trans isomerase [Microbacterium sp. No. 7]ALJ21151.1 peptidylprolyl isomerase [Microbacterium sp. No. 7]